MNILLNTGNHKIETSGRLRNDEEIARAWRDNELLLTDHWVSVTDHPQHTAIMTYRQALRDWPQTQDFPNNKPTM